MNASPRLKAGLLKHSLGNEVVVYNPADDQVHLLDKTTATAFDLLLEGKFNDVTAPAEMSRRVGAPNGAMLFELALDELRSSGLIADRVTTLDVSRRDMLRKAVLAGAAALAIPAVATLTATRAYGQLGSNNRPNCAPCTAGTQCASGTCGSGGACAGGSKSPTGAGCTGGGNCCSGTCSGGVCA